jgi:predicted lysophospholipase L1 biosynthesis ABC-type transport system permease subunit
MSQGRDFELSDNAGAPVAIVNETAARLFWPNESPLGKRVEVRSQQLPGELPRQVIGVVPEIAQYSFQQNRPQVYVPFRQIERLGGEQMSARLRNVTFILRTNRSPAEATEATRVAIAQADSNQAVAQVQTMEQSTFSAAKRRVLFISMIGLFGVIAVVLALVGVYGVMSSTVKQRSSELGIRIALGASPRQIRRLVIGQGSALIGIGLLIGVVSSIGVTRVLRSFLFGTSPTDPLTFILGIGLLAGVALLACYLPARRASRIDALTALRHD